MKEFVLRGQRKQLTAESMEQCRVFAQILVNMTLLEFAKSLMESNALLAKSRQKNVVHQEWESVEKEQAAGFAQQISDGEHGASAAAIKNPEKKSATGLTMIAMEEQTKE